MIQDPMDAWREERESFRRRLAFLFVGIIGGLVLLFGPGESLLRWARYTLPRLGMSEAEIALEQIHAQLLPDWMIALPRGSTEEREALLAATSGDPTLGALAQELVDKVESDPWGNGERIVQICEQWTSSLRAEGKPWILECNVVDMGRGPVFYTKSYHVEADLVATVGGAPYRAMLLRRADNTNVVEQYLGHAGDQETGARLLVDRITEGALEIWAMLAEEGPVTEALLQELSAALPAEHLELLKSTAPQRLALKQATDAINSRSECSRYGVNTVPPLGFEHADLDAFQQVAFRESAYCPRVKGEEARVLVESSRALQSTSGLREALGTLAAHLARATFAHEVRHLADLAAWGEDEAQCPGCAEEQRPSVLREASAYLAAFGTPGLGQVALAQACLGTAGYGGSHGAALHLIGEAGLDAFCWQGPPDDLPGVSRRIEETLFGRHDEVVVPPLPPLDIRD